ncbi:retropepsin-like aspartic protease family protein [Alteromonas sp. a30]|uniref:retropepsin-like aspartic protease family protein n=1 Tax=Alteromonas sp. a30 TaxID=2730917 RepID=UPI0022826C65|nr:retropepsin-like aspartic protease [Alteromonas sp. a30]MCY7294230.1 clan AA aspartic protease [Alteromonas sp. a30]
MQEPQSPESNNQHNKTGKWMFALAWIAALLLVTIWFDDLLMERINPNAEPQSYRSSSGVEVRLKQNMMGHYVVTGSINGRKVVFLLDTGATSVSIPAHLTDELGLIPGMQGRAQTANGIVTVFNTRISELTLGDITLNDVSGTLNPGMKSDEILLGMSALKDLEFTQKDGWLVLRDTRFN